MKNVANRPLHARRRCPLTSDEAAYIHGRIGKQSELTLSTVVGMSRSSVRRAILKAEHGAPAAPSRPCRPRQPLPPPPVLRTASLAFDEAAREVGLSAEALYAWLVVARWIRRDSTGATIAAATRLAAGFLNQPVRHEYVGRRGMRLHYGAIRFTPRGMANLRAQITAAAGETL